MNDGREIGTVVNHDLWRVAYGGSNVLVVSLVVLAVDRERRNPVFRHERGGNVVLRTQGVAGAENGVRPSRLQREHQVCRFRRHMGAGCDSDTFEWTLPGEPLSNLRDHIHLAGCPLDSTNAG